MISSAGPSASEIIFTERTTAGGPLWIGGSSGVWARPKPVPSVAAKTENNTSWQPIRGKDFTSQQQGLFRQQYHRAGAGKSNKGLTPCVGLRGSGARSDLGRQAPGFGLLS